MARAGEEALTRRERRERRQFQLLTGDEGSLAFTMAFCDRVLRPEANRIAAAQFRAVAQGAKPAFLGTADRALLGAGARVAPLAPALVMPLTRRRLRQIVGGLVLDRADPALGRSLERLRSRGFAVNVNLLGESVLGDDDAARRVRAIEELIRRPDVDYVSVKASAVASQLNLWGYEASLQRVKDALRRLYLAAGGEGSDATFVNLDMEEYRDLRLTVDAFTQLLAEPDLRGLDAGIVLQAYLPDSFGVLQELLAWAGRRRAGGGGTVTVRVVKGANLAMESVEAAMHGWNPAPYASKPETDANFKRMLDWAMQPELLGAVRLGVASHNLFDVAWAQLLAGARGVAAHVQMEMLQGMAPGISGAVQDATGQVRLYTPVVAADDFDNALAYLFRRLEENSSGQNFLRHLFELGSDPAAFEVERTPVRRRRSGALVRLRRVSPGLPSSARSRLSQRAGIGSAGPGEARPGAGGGVRLSAAGASSRDHRYRGHRPLREQCTRSGARAVGDVAPAAAGAAAPHRCAPRVPAAGVAGRHGS